MNEVHILQWFRRHGTIYVINRANTYYTRRKQYEAI